jgi:hypothetical protein
MDFFDPNLDIHLRTDATVRVMAVWYCLNVRLLRSYHQECSKTVEPLACEVQLPGQILCCAGSASCWYSRRRNDCGLNITIGMSHAMLWQDDLEKKKGVALCSQKLSRS